MRNVEIDDALVYRAKPIVNNARGIQYELSQMRLRPHRLLIQCGQYVTGGRHSDGFAHFLGPRFQVRAENPLFFFL